MKSHLLDLMTLKRSVFGREKNICLVKQSNRPLRNNLKKEKEQNDKIIALSVIKKQPKESHLSDHNRSHSGEKPSKCVFGD